MCWFRKFKIYRLEKKLLNMKHSRLQNQGSQEMLLKELVTYMKLAKIYASLHGNKKFPFSKEQSLACLRAAAVLGDVNAQFVLGQKLLEEAKLRDTLQKSELFNSDSNAIFMQELYKEAHAFLCEAEKNKHVNAKRIRGLCYINAWGVAENKDLGFDLVVASIEEENSWDRVQKIFKELGINQASFFSELFKHRKS